MLQLPNANQVNQSNYLDVIRKLILAMQELADQSGTRDTVLLGEISTEIHGLRAEMNTGFADLRAEMKQGFEKHTEILTHQGALLNQIKTEFITEQKETNSLLRELLAKK